MTATWRDLLRPELRASDAYEVPSPRGVRVRLDANENPYATPPEVAADLADVVRNASLHRYPDPGARELRAQLTRRLGVEGETLVIGNGADECIAMVCACFGHPTPGRPARIAYPAPTFVMYRTYAVIAGCEPLPVPLRSDFTLDEAALERAVAEHAPAVVFLSRPNNPTGGLWLRGMVQRLAERFPGTVVVSDEAYIDYAAQPDESAVSLLGHHPNLIVLRTLSKVGLAGLRLGFAIAAPDVARELNKVRGPYNVGTITQQVAARILERHWEALRSSLAAIRAECKRLAAALRARPEVEVFPSAANFVLCRFPDGNAVWRGLLDHGVLVRHYGAAGPLAHCLRITIGTPEENNALLAALDAVRI